MLLKVEEIKRLNPQQKGDLKYLASRKNDLPKDGIYKGMLQHELLATRLLAIDSAIEFSVFLQTGFKTLEKLINEPLYQKFSIAKRRGGSRDIYAPAEDLKCVQKKLNSFLQAYYTCLKPICVHGFVMRPNDFSESYGIVSNARVHTGKKHLLNIDLKDFFSTISAGQVKSLFLSGTFQYDNHIATALTLLTTYKGFVPIGAPTSPVISNFVCLGLDADMLNLGKERSLTFSRYADDLTFSSNAAFTVDDLNAIYAVIAKHGFLVNERKVRMVGGNRKQTVTGLVVNEKVNIDRKLIKRIRAMLHDLNCNGAEIATMKHFRVSAQNAPNHVDGFLNKLRGYIDFVGQVRGREDALYLRFRRQF